ncbi:MAG: tRNA (uridine(34)/cytosine(34)/5-carboxymethylaminomethyluridine(34)-2'-O)-methyltransferase TrmL [Clostridia bacterium]|nr:tRNA (uridine(34)/cytosine(34)/5-carboxymethylaminomethyluridine(34)-2'-O)-methyltransferase TrmL [Clostridia bacterium]
MVHIVLVEPEIPSNTGNIARSCAATNSTLHLVRPLGFDTSDKMLKRAGLDYWKDVNICYHDSFSELQAQYPDGQFYYFSTKSDKNYCDVNFPDEVFLVFGKETAGLPEELIHKNYDKALRIPMMGEIRSLNLSNSVAIALYEVLRQHNFDGFNTHGKLTKY